jgi:acylglycerol lipase
MNKKHGFTFQGTSFFWQSWEATQSNAVLLIIHGMGEHSGRYAHVAEFFNTFNYVVCAMDHYGHGHSGGKKGDIPSMEYMLQSVAVFIQEVQKTYGVKPTVICGHSMGGNVVANYLIQKSQQFKSAIITSPWLILPASVPKWRILLAKLMMKIFPGFQDSTKLDATAISRIPEEVKKYQNDPLVHDYMTPRFFFTMEEAGLFAIDYADRINIPVLLMHGKADRLTYIGGSVMFYENNPEKIHFKAWDEAYHELHNDTIRQEVLEYMIDFVAGRMQ